jgi:hypothetical protein
MHLNIKIFLVAMNCAGVRLVIHIKLNTHDLILIYTRGMTCMLLHNNINIIFLENKYK